MWRKRFFEEGLAGLEERPRQGRPPAFPPEVRAEVKALACKLLSQRGLPLSRFSSAEIARAAVAAGLCDQVSGATIWRWLSEDAIKLWQHRSWIFPRDPAFREKDGRVLDLYQGRWQGKLLHPGEYKIGRTNLVDRRPERCRPTGTPGSSRRASECAANGSSSALLTSPP